MFQRQRPVTEPAAPLREGEAHDTCVRCGRPTPLGVSLCVLDNPARIKSPSSTQVHGTIVIGVLSGFVLLAVLLRLAVTGVGPFEASIVGSAPRADGSVEITLSIANGGTRQAGASCRVSAGGAPDYRDQVFFTDPIPAGETRQLSRVLLPPDGVGAIRPSSIAVRCN